MSSYQSHARYGQRLVQPWKTCWLIRSAHVAIGTFALGASHAAGRELSDDRHDRDAHIGPQGASDVPLFLVTEHIISGTHHPDHSGAFEAYIRKHRRKYTPGSEEFVLRFQLFKERLTKVIAHNAKSGHLWQAGINRFTDRTNDERSKILGWRDSGRGSSRLTGGSTYIGLEEVPSESRRSPIVLTKRTLKMSENVTYPEAFSWQNLTMARHIPDQEQCGGCWAVSAASVLEAHYEIYNNKTRNFSAQQIVSCTPNPRDCGGTGGCQGATVELAFDWVLHHGCADAQTVPYVGNDITAEAARCNDVKPLLLGFNDSSVSASSSAPLSSVSEEVSEAPSISAGGLAFGMHGYNMLERNQAEPLMQALYTMGPVAVSASAGSWMDYQSGIFDDCQADTVVDHAVTLYGYGSTTVHTKNKGSDDDTWIVLTGTKVAKKHVQDQLIDYWLIRNSWGPDWGEKGYIRLLRSDKQGQNKCGVDTKPDEGTGCKDGPSNVTVCGMCGVLYDSVIPHFGPHHQLAFLEAGHLPERPLWWDLPHYRHYHQHHSASLAQSPRNGAEVNANPFGNQHAPSTGKAVADIWSSETTMKMVRREQPANALL